MTLPLEFPSKQQASTRDMTVVHFTGCNVSLDNEALVRIRDQLLALTDEPCASDLVLDFGNVEYVAGAVLGTVVDLQRKLLASGRQLTVANLSPRVHEVFTAARLDTFLDLQRAGQETDPPATRYGQSHQAGRAPRSRQDRWIKTHSKGA
jgi:anti-anti-sigma factor